MCGLQGPVATEGFIILWGSGGFSHPGLPCAGASFFQGARAWGLLYPDRRWKLRPGAQPVLQLGLVLPGWGN